MALAHGWSAFCAFGIAATLQGAGASPEFRLRIGETERERGYNFKVVGLFLFALAMDLASAPFGIEGTAHIAAITLACLTGTIALSLFAWRLRPWKR